MWVGTVGPAQRVSQLPECFAPQPHSLLQQQGTCGHPERSLNYVGRVVLGRRRVRVDVACSAGGRKEQGCVLVSAFPGCCPGVASTAVEAGRVGAD